MTAVEKLAKVGSIASEPGIKCISFDPLIIHEADNTISLVDVTAMCKSSSASCRNVGLITCSKLS